MRQAVDSIIQELNRYITINAARRRLSKNKNRDIFFSLLVHSIEVIRDNQHITAQEKLTAIKSELELVSKINNGLDGDVDAHHDGVSTATLTNALRSIDEAIGIENQEAVRRRAEAAQEETRRRREDIQRAEESGARKYQARLKTEADEQDAYQLQTNPVSILEHAIQSDTLDQVDLSQLISYIEAIVSRDNNELTAIQKRFYLDLEKECENLKIQIDPATLALISRAPLSNRYEKLVTASAQHDSKKSARALRAMIHTLGEILKISLANQSLQNDIYFLGVLEDENALLALFEGMYGKNMLSLPSHDLSVAEPAEHDTYSKQVLHTLDAFRQASDINIPQLGTTLEQFKLSAQSSEKDQPTDEHTASIQDEITHASTQLIQCVKLFSIISQLKEFISIKTKGLVDETKTEDAYKKHAVLEKIAQNLRPQFLLLIQLMQLAEKNHAALSDVVQKLERLFQHMQHTRKNADNHAIKQRLQSLNTHCQLWMTRFQNTKTSLVGMLATLGNIVDEHPQAGLTTIDALQQLTQEARREAELKAQIQDELTILYDELSRRTEIADVIRSVNKQSKNAAASSQPAISSECQSQLFSTLFLVKLANKLSTQQHDSADVIALIHLLQKNKLFTPFIQQKLLQKNNVACLLSLQTFLMKCDIQVTPIELGNVWNKLHGNVTFDLLVPLQEKLKLNVASVANIIANLSTVWIDSLKMLTIMFNECDNPAVCNVLIDASEHDPKMVRKVFVIFEAIMNHVQDKLTELMHPVTMRELTHAIANAESRFTIELVTRIKAVDYAPFKPEENLTYLIQRTRQYDERNLSYTNLLQEWRKNAKKHGFFDDYSQVLLGHYSTHVEYRGGHQVNIAVAQPALSLSGPPIDKTDEVQWHRARAHTSVVHSVNEEALDRMHEALSRRVTINQSDQFSLQILQIAMRQGGIVFTDQEKQPSLIGWMEEPKQLMDYYLYFTIRGLREKVARLTQMIHEAKALHSELTRSGITDLRSFTIDLMSAPQSDMKLIDTTPTTVDVNARVMRYGTLVREIAEAKNQLNLYATAQVHHGFDLPLPSVVNSVSTFQPKTAANDTVSEKEVHHAY